MKPFFQLPQFPFIICKICRFACIADEIALHLKKYYKGINASARREIVRKVQDIPGIIKNQKELSTWPKPPPTTDPIPYIQPPVIDKLGCGEEGCLFAVGTPRGIQEHYRKKQGWRNSGERGRRLMNQPIDPREVPWRTGVQAQRLFRHGPASGWFEVGFGAAVRQTPDEAAIGARLMHTLDQQQRRLDLEDKERIKAADPKLHANAWLEHVGWTTHLQGFDPEAMQRLVDSIDEEEHALQKNATFEMAPEGDR